jgi:hypothetical protein
VPRRITVYDLQNEKGGRKWLQLHVDTPAESAAAFAADIPILSCEPDHNLEAIRKAAPYAFLSAGMPHGAVATPGEAVRLGFDMLRRGADAVYCSHSPRFIEAMAMEGMPFQEICGLCRARSRTAGKARHGVPGFRRGRRERSLSAGGPSGRDGGCRVRAFPGPCEGDVTEVIMDDLAYGKRNKRGDWTPDKPAPPAPLFTFPPQPLKLLKWLPHYFLPYNVLFATSAVAW